MLSHAPQTESDRQLFQIDPSIATYAFQAMETSQYRSVQIIFLGILTLALATFSSLFLRIFFMKVFMNIFISWFIS